MARLGVLLVLLPALSWAWVKEMENKGLYQGDMILSPEQMQQVKEGNYKFGSIKDSMWPTTIPYDYDDSLANEPMAHRAVEAAIKEYEKYTCLRFKRRTTETTYMSFYWGGGCSSGVGMYTGKNMVSLAKGCWSRSTAIHEIGHSLGFHHEQSRPDRDSYLTILWNNIYKSMKYNFDIGKGIDSRGTPYDYFSVMHYSKDAFGIDSKTTMQTKDPYYQELIGTGLGLSPMDIKQVNLVYKCKPYTGELPLHPTPECHDTSSYCEMNIWEDPDYCKNPQQREKYCPVACGACIPGQKREPPCYDVAIEGCAERVKNCFNPNSGWEKWMKDNCFKTCGYCGKSTLAPGVTNKPTTEPCVDHHTMCASRVKQCQNPHSGWIQFMKKNCPKTCGYCGDATVPPAATTVPPTVPVTTAKPVPTCKNTRDECDSWKKYCNETGGGWKDYMARSCPVTCGLC